MRSYSPLYALTFLTGVVALGQAHLSTKLCAPVYLGIINLSNQLIDEAGSWGGLLISILRAKTSLCIFNLHFVEELWISISLFFIWA